MKNLIFMDVVGTGARRYKITLPPHIQKGSIISLSLVTYSMEYEQQYDDDGNFFGPYYAQMKFSEGFETGAVTSGSHPDMFPIPLLSFDGWAPSGNILPIPVYKGQLVKETFFLELYDMGPTPKLLDFHRALFWFVIETEEGIKTTTFAKL
jgi:hypothetical protein